MIHGPLFEVYGENHSASVEYDSETGCITIVVYQNKDDGSVLNNNLLAINAHITQDILNRLLHSGPGVFEFVGQEAEVIYSASEKLKDQPNIPSVVTNKWEKTGTIKCGLVFNEDNMFVAVEYEMI
jgi:hypothetical protein